MGKHALTVKTVRDGPVCALILSGDLGLTETGGFLGQATLAIDNRTERLVLDLAEVNTELSTGDLRVRVAITVSLRVWLFEHDGLLICAASSDGAPLLVQY